MVDMKYASMIPLEYAMGLQEAGYQEIARYAEKNKHNMTARNLLSTRSIGPLEDFYSILEVKSSGERAQIVAKGTAPDTVDVFGKQTIKQVYQLALGFNIHERDVAKDPKIQTRNIDVIQREIHRKEDDVFINGDTDNNISGLTTVAAANKNGVVAATGGTYNNKGAWDGSETGGVMDPFSDLNLGFALMQPDFRMADTKLLLTSLEMSYLFELDSMRQSFADKICGLFRKPVGDYSWMWVSDLCPAGYAYLVPKDIMAGELVFSEDITIDTDFPKDKGGNFYCKLYEWLGMSFYTNEAYVQIATT